MEMELRKALDRCCRLFCASDACAGDLFIGLHCPVGTRVPAGQICFERAISCFCTRPNVFSFLRVSYPFFQTLVSEMDRP